MALMKEQNKSPGKKKVNKMETSNLLDAELNYNI